MAQFYTLPTAIGEAKIANAIALGTSITITDLAIGDGGGVTPVPDSDRTMLVNEVRRAPINTSVVDPDNPNWIVVEQVLPPDVGGWTIREIGLYDADGDLIAYGNYPETYKPQLSEGSGRTQTIRFVMQVSDTATVTLKVDPSVVLATRKYADDGVAAHEQDPQAHTDDQIALSADIPQAPGATNVGAALAALGDFAADGYQNIAVFDAPGVTAWPVPQMLKDGIRKANVTVLGGGGGGALSSDAQSSYGGAGAGGASISLLDLTGVSTVTVTVGAGGAGAANAGNPGTNGGSSSFGAYLSASGGDGVSTASLGFGAEGGIGTGGLINVNGGNGYPATSTVNSAANYWGGQGGDSILGGGGRGGSNAFSTPGTGAGGGSKYIAGSVPDGGDGIVIVRW
ncbi:phage tail protein [Halomonas sp. M20]|uniref:phage tail protein n=1 Tax=Halomonas sp. M20 TaxID=2763264 RepID=UPI001D0AFD94|nr:phage tail protein [Halomonas sp. M20]